MQKKIDDWHIKNKGKEFNLDEYKKFLLDIGDLKNEGPDFKIETENVDEEIASIAGPQLVVPVMNARYALNAANARWMSLYDSLSDTCRLLILMYFSCIALYYLPHLYFCLRVLLLRRN